MGEIKLMDYYNEPKNCKQCGGVMVYKGVGEYHCEACKFVDYDDYGKARLFIEEHPGATAAEVEAGVGVSQRSIRHMLKESRLEVAEGCKSFLRCELCGKEIRCGYYCQECEPKAKHSHEAEQRERLKKEDKMKSKQDAGERQNRFVRG